MRAKSRKKLKKIKRALDDIKKAHDLYPDNKKYVEKFEVLNIIIYYL